MRGVARVDALGPKIGSFVLHCSSSAEVVVEVATRHYLVVEVSYYGLACGHDFASFDTLVDG